MEVSDTFSFQAISLFVRPSRIPERTSCCLWVRGRVLGISALTALVPAAKERMMLSSSQRCPCATLPASSTGRCNTGLQFTRRRFKAQGLSRALIEAQRYLVEIGLRVDG